MKHPATCKFLPFRIQHNFAIVSESLMPSMSTHTTGGPAKRFAPLDPVKANPHNAPPLKGIVFDVDGTLWYVFSVSPLCTLFFLPGQSRKEKKEEVYSKIDYSCAVCRLDFGGCCMKFHVRIHGCKIEEKRYNHILISSSYFPDISSLPMPYYINAHLSSSWRL